MGHPLPLFHLFQSTSDNLKNKSCRLQQDSNLGRRSRRPSRWPLDQHHGPSGPLIRYYLKCSTGRQKKVQEGWSRTESKEKNSNATWKLGNERQRWSHSKKGSKYCPTNWPTPDFWLKATAQAQSWNRSDQLGNIIDNLKVWVSGSRRFWISLNAR